MRITHLYTGDDGESHFRDLNLRQLDSQGGPVFELLSAVEGFAIRDLVHGWSTGFHNCPRRQLVVQLTGRGEVECGDGEIRCFGPGDVLLADDVTGRGHISREIEGPRRQAYVYLDPQLNLDTLGEKGIR